MWIRKPLPGGAIDALDYNFRANGEEKGLHRERYEWANSRIKDNSLVIDMATGLGYGVSILSKKDRVVIGIDKSKSYIDYANSHYSNSDNNVFMILDLENSEELNSIKLNCNILNRYVVSFETIEHLEKPEIMIEWIHANCSDFLLSAPIKENGIDKNEHHAQVFRTKEELIELVSREDWELKEEQEQSNHVLMLRLEKKQVK